MSEYSNVPTANPMETAETTKEISVVELLRETKDTLLETRRILEETISLVANRVPEPFKGPEVLCMRDEAAGLSFLATCNMEMAKELKEVLG